MTGDKTGGQAFEIWEAVRDEGEGSSWAKGIARLNRAESIFQHLLIIFGRRMS